MGIKATLIGVALLSAAVCQHAKAELLQGIGSTSCGEFAKMYSTNPKETELFYFSWAQGFMSALNFSNSVSGDRVIYRQLKTTKEQMAALRTYCNRHPLADYYEAVLDVYKGLPFETMKSKSGR